MEILDSIELKEKNYFRNPFWKWSILLLVFCGGFIQVYSLIQDYFNFIKRDGFLDLIGFGWSGSEYYSNQEYIQLIGLVGIIFSFFELWKNKELPKYFKDQLILISPFLLLFIDWIIGENLWKFF